VFGLSVSAIASSYRVERQEVVVLIVAVGRRRSGDKSDVYELARKLLRQRLLR
jgi:hypothetical protein